VLSSCAQIHGLAPCRPGARPFVAARALPFWRTPLRRGAPSFYRGSPFFVANHSQVAQVGTHAGNRRTYGHSLVVSPWGEVLADAGEEGPGFITAELDLALVDEARRSVPSLKHDRIFRGPDPA
jgi:hypothetical protein